MLHPSRCTWFWRLCNTMAGLPDMHPLRDCCRLQISTNYIAERNFDYIQAKCTTRQRRNRRINQYSIFFPNTKPWMCWCCNLNLKWCAIQHIEHCHFIHPIMSWYMPDISSPSQSNPSLSSAVPEFNHRSFFAWIRRPFLTLCDISESISSFSRDVPLSIRFWLCSIRGHDNTIILRIL